MPNCKTAQPNPCHVGHCWLPSASCILGGTPGITVVKEGVPHLLSVLLESTGARIDMRKNTVHYQELRVSEAMMRMKSGHRLVASGWKGGKFPVPPDLRKEFHPKDGAFNLEESDNQPGCVRHTS